MSEAIRNNKIIDKYGQHDFAKTQLWKLALSCVGEVETRFEDGGELLKEFVKCCKAECKDVDPKAFEAAAVEAENAAAASPVDGSFGWEPVQGQHQVEEDDKSSDEDNFDDVEN